MRRLVETVQRLDLRQALGVHALVAPVGAATRLEAASAATTGRLRLRQVLLHRTTRYELDHQKRDKQDPQQGRDEQQQPLENIGEHGRFPSRLGFRRGLAHQVPMTQSSPPA